MRLWKSITYNFNKRGKRLLAGILAALMTVGQFQAAPGYSFASVFEQEDIGDALERCDEIQPLPYMNNLEEMSDKEALAEYGHAKTDRVATSSSARKATMSEDQVAVISNANVTRAETVRVAESGREESGAGKTQAQPASASDAQAATRSDITAEGSNPASASDADGGKLHFRAPDLVAEKGTKIDMFYGIVGDRSGYYVGCDLWTGQDLLSLSDEGTYELAYVIADSKWNVVAEFSRTITVTDLESDEVWVSDAGRDTNAGTEESPLQTLQGAQKKVRAGGTVHVTGTLSENDISACREILFPIKIAGEESGAKLERGTVTLGGAASAYADPIFTVGNGGSLTLENIEVTGGNAPDCASLILVEEGGNLELEQSVTLKDNTGGAVDIRGTGSMAATGNNTVTISGMGKDAPAVKVSGSGSVKLEDCSIQENQGGAVSFIQYNGTAVLKSCALSGNSGTNGAAVNLSGGSGSVKLEDCTLEHNAAQYGGAISARNSSGRLELSGVNMSKNVASKRGGAVDAVSSGLTAVIRAGKIADNGTEADASSLYLSGVNLRLAGEIQIKDNYGKVIYSGATGLSAGDLFTVDGSSTAQNLMLTGKTDVKIMESVKSSAIRIHHFGETELMESGAVLAYADSGYTLTAADAAGFELDDANNGKEFLADTARGAIVLKQQMNDIYVRADGDDANMGTESAPVKTFDRAYTVVEPGGRIHIVGPVETASQVLVEKDLSVIGEKDRAGAGGSIQAAAVLDSLLYITSGAAVTTRDVTFSGKNLSGQTLGNYDLIRVSNASFTAESGTRLTEGKRGGIALLDKNALAVMKDGSEIDNCYGYSASGQVASGYQRGTAVAVAGGTFLMEGGSIHDNMSGDDKQNVSAVHRGIIYASKGARIEISGSSEIRKNRAVMGAALFAEGPGVTITVKDQAQIAENIGDCGIVSAETGALINIEGGSVCKNIAIFTRYMTSGTVGAILQVYDGSVHISGGSIKDNGTSLARAAVDTNNKNGKSTVELSGNSVIADNYTNVTLINDANGLVTGFTRGAGSQQLNLCAPTSSGLKVNVKGDISAGLIRVGKTLTAGTAFASGDGYTVTDADAMAFQSDSGSVRFKADTGSNKIAAAAAGRDVYVSSDGDDENDGLSAATPVLTWTQARTIINNLPDGSDWVICHVKGHITGGTMSVNATQPNQMIVGESDASGMPAVLEEIAGTHGFSCTDGTIRIKNLQIERAAGTNISRPMVKLNDNSELYLDAGAVLKGAAGSAVKIASPQSALYMSEGSLITDCFNMPAVDAKGGTVVMNGGEISRCIGGKQFADMEGKLPGEVYDTESWLTAATNAGAIRGGAGTKITIRGDSKITGNVGACGAIFVDAGGSLLIEGNTQFSRNAGKYAAVAAAGESTPPAITIKGGTFTDNYADETILRSPGRLDIEGGVFTGNGVGGSEYLTIDERGTAALSGAPVIKENYINSAFGKSYGENWKLTGTAYGSIRGSEKVLITGPLLEEADIFLLASEADAVAAKGEGSYKLTADDAARFRSEQPGFLIEPDLANNRLVVKQVGDLYVSKNGSDGWSGNKEHPLKTLSVAADHVADGGVIHVLDEVTVEKKISLEKLGKSITVTGENGAGVLHPAVAADGSANGLFEIGTGRTLTLSDIALDAKKGRLTEPLVTVTDGGTFRLQKSGSSSVKTALRNIGAPGNGGATAGYSAYGAITLSGAAAVCEVGEGALITDCYVKANQTGGAQAQGGAITMTGGTLKLRGEITGCHVSGIDNGGAGLRMQGGTADLEDGAAIKECEATYGSAVLMTGGTLNLGAAVIEGNTAETGGAVVCDATALNPAEFNMTDGAVRNNYTKYSGVSAVEVGNYTTFTMTGGEITGNMADIQTFAIDGSANHEKWVKDGLLWKKTENRVTGNKIRVGGSASITGNSSADPLNEYGSDLVLYPGIPLEQVSARTPEARIVISAKEDPDQTPIGSRLPLCDAVRPDLVQCKALTARDGETYFADGKFSGASLTLYFDKNAGTVRYDTRTGVLLVSDLPSEVSLSGRVKLDPAGARVTTPRTSDKADGRTNLEQLYRGLESGYEELAKRAEEDLIFDGWYWKNASGNFEPYLFDGTQTLEQDGELYASWREKTLPVQEKESFRITQKALEEPVAAGAAGVEKQIHLTVKVPNASGGFAGYNPKEGKGFRTDEQWKTAVGEEEAKSRSCVYLSEGSVTPPEWLAGKAGKGKEDDTYLCYIAPDTADVYPVRILNLQKEDDFYLYYEGEVTVPADEFDAKAEYFLSAMNWYGDMDGKNTAAAGTPVPVGLDMAAPRADMGTIEVMRDEAQTVRFEIGLKDVPETGAGRGIKEIAWSKQDAKAAGSTILPALLGDKFDVSNKELRGVRVLNPASGSYRYEMEISKAELQNLTMAYLYLKDAAGNTSEVEIPLNQDQIVRVSYTTDLRMTLMRSPGGTGTGTLHDLCSVGIGADQFEIRNNGSVPVKAAILKVKNINGGANALKLVETVSAGGGRNAREVAVTLKPLRNAHLASPGTFGGAGEFSLARCAGPAYGEAELAEIPARNVVSFKLEPTFWDDVPKDATGEWEIAYRFRPVLNPRTAP